MPDEPKIVTAIFPIRDAEKNIAATADSLSAYVAGPLTQTTLAVKGVFDRVNALFDRIPKSKAEAVSLAKSFAQDMSDSKSEVK